MAGTGGYGGAAVKPAVIDLNAEAVDDFKDVVRDESANVFRKPL